MYKNSAVYLSHCRCFCKIQELRNPTISGKIHRKKKNSACWKHASLHSPQHLEWKLIYLGVVHLDGFWLYQIIGVFIFSGEERREATEGDTEGVPMDDSVRDAPAEHRADDWGETTEDWGPAWPLIWKRYFDFAIQY